MQKITILYGSETGTAQDIAERIWRESKWYSFHGPVKAMNDYEVPLLIHESLIVFVCSTTGQGDMPNNMKIFWQFLLRKSLPSNSLKKLKFAVLGLGDSSYSKFNFAARRLNKRLLSLGATCIVDIGLADDQHDLGPDAVVDVWIETLWHTLQSLFSNTVEPVIRINTLSPPRWKVNTYLEYSEDISQFQYPYQEKLIETTVTANKRVTSPEHFQDVRILQFSYVKNMNEMNQVKIDQYHVAVFWPENKAMAINRFYQLFSKKLNLNQQTVIKLEQIYDDMPVPPNLQRTVFLKDLIHKYWNLNAIPRRYVFKILSNFATNILEREKLEELSSSEGQQSLFDYCNRPKRTILEVLADFPSATENIPLNYFFEIFQSITPRQFSISEMCITKKHTKYVEIRLEILLAVVNYKTKLLIPRYGLCSNWLANKLVGDKVELVLNKGALNFPENKDTSVLMITPGTGVAAVKNFIMKRAELDLQDTAFSIQTDAIDNVTLSDKGSDLKKYPKLILIFGCRHQDSDYYFKNEWPQCKNFKIFTAFSRDQPHKIYVQHIIKNQSDIVTNLIFKEKGYVIISGNSKVMPTEVRNAIIKTLSKENLLKSEEAEIYIKQMEKEGRYQTETWN